MEDVSLFKKLQKGDRSAFKEIYVTYYSPLCEYASHFVDDHDAEEIVSDLMLYIWDSKKTLHIHTSLESYLFTAVKFRCFNSIKRKQTQRIVHTAIYEKLKDQVDSPDYYLVNELSMAIDKAIEELPDIYRETFKMSRFGTDTNAQIAKQLDISIKTVEYRISNSLKILYTKLKEYLICTFFM